MHIGTFMHLNQVLDGGETQPGWRGVEVEKVDEVTWIEERRDSWDLNGGET